MACIAVDSWVVAVGRCVVGEMTVAAFMTGVSYVGYSSSADVVCVVRGWATAMSPANLC